MTAIEHLHVVPLLPVAILALVLFGLRDRASMPPPRRYAWWALIAAILATETGLIVSTMGHNVALVPEWDFLGFWLNAHVAGAGHNFYDPTQARALAAGIATSSDFRREILDVGFWYPPPSIFIFLPLAAIANVHVAYVAWFVLQSAALIISAVVLGRRFLPGSKPVEATAIVGALLLLMPATLSTVSYGQTSFLALMFTSLFWTTRDSARGGIWLVLATLTKPFTGLLTLTLLCRRMWRPLAGAVAAAFVVSLLTLVTFGATTFFAYFKSRPDARIPAWVYVERTNQSLLGLILRLGHHSFSEHLPRAPLFVFTAIALAMIASTIILCLRADVDPDIALGMTLSLALFVYPASQSFYAVLLVIPALIVWNRCEASASAYVLTVTGIIVAYGFMAVGLTELAYFFSWIGFGVIATPARVREPFDRSLTSIARDVGGLVKKDQTARSTAVGLTVAFVAAVFLVVAHDALMPKKSLSANAGTDFRAFYCSGVTENERASPYLLEPLRGCEHAVQPAKAWSDALVVPSPLPGYDVALFAAIAHLPYGLAKAAWLGMSLGCLFLSAWLLARLTRFPALLILLTLSLVDGYEALKYGQLPPLVVASLCAAAYLCERRRYALAAMAAAVSMIEPHLGLPACLAMFVWLPQSRVAFGGAFITLTAISAAVMGVPDNIAYLTRYLPEQAAAELVAVDQYGLSHQLHLLGLSDALALRLGLASYVLMLVIGVLLARRTASALGSDAAIVALPVAAACLGGSYIHDIQFAAALPCALLFAARANVFRTAAQFALMLLIFPWYSLSSSETKLGIAASIVAMATIVWLGSAVQPNLRAGWRLGIAATAALLLVAVLSGPKHVSSATSSALSAPTLPASVLTSNASATSNWAAYLRAEPQLSVSTARKELEKLPTWFGIVLVLLVAGAQGRERAKYRVPARVPTLDVRAQPGAAYELGSN